MIKRLFYALGISILVFVLSEAFNLTLIRDMYDSGQAVMAAVADQEFVPKQLESRSNPDEIRQPPDLDYIQAIENTAAMVWNDDAIRLADKYGLNILNVTWEDTGRYYNSSVGPNISDVTIQIQHTDPNSRD